MDEGVKAVITTLLGLGLPGIIIIALGFAVFNLFNKFVDSQNARITERGETVKAVEANTDALGRLSDLIRARKGLTE